LLNFERILDDFIQSEKKEIAIIGKGQSIDSINSKTLDKFYVININDSEAIYAGDICIIYYEWAKKNIQKLGNNCKFYITDSPWNDTNNYLIIDRVSENPEEPLPIQKRFFIEEIYLEDVVLLTAIKIANWIANKSRKRLNVNLLGCDFKLSTGLSRQFEANDLHNDYAAADSIIRAQEAYLEFIWSHKESLSINLLHIGDKKYSNLSIKSFIGKDIKISSTKVKKVESIENIGNYKVKIVAEFTTNHFGDLNLLKKMIIASKESGADYFKIQKRNVSSFYSQKQLKMPYDSPFGATFLDYRNGLELDEAGFEKVQEWSKEYEIPWFSSILDLDSYYFIKNYEPQLIKLPSTISEHHSLLKKVANDFNGDVVISTGMTDSKYENFILNNFNKVKKLYLLQCVSTYPTLVDDANVAVVRHYHDLSIDNTNVVPGYSSHDVGSLCSSLAVAAGAKMIEKHVKYGNTPWAHFDNVAIDLLTNNFRKFVSDIRQAEVALGDGNKQVLNSENHKYFLKK